MSNTIGDASTSFSATKINKSTFVIREDDAYKEHPFIYVKVHPKVPIIVLSDTGCDEPSGKHKDGMSWFTLSPRLALFISGCIARVELRSLVHSKCT